MESLISTIRRFQSGAPEALEELYRIESPRLGRFIRRYERSEDLAEDVFQEVWFRVWSKRKQLRSPQRFTSWLYRIARNCIFEQMRKRKRRVELTVFGDLDDPTRFADPLAHLAAPGPGPRAQAAQAQMISLIDAEIGKLDEVSREILALRFGAGLGLREIAEVLDRPLGTVCAKVSRSLATVKRKLAREGIRWEI